MRQPSLTSPLPPASVLPHTGAFGSLDAATPELIRSVVDSVPTLIAYFDDGLVCRYANASYRRMFELPGQALEGASFESLVLPVLRDAIMPKAQAALRGEPQAFEYERPSQPGKPAIHVDVKYTPDQREGRVHGMFVELHDITNHKRIEELVLDTNRDLEQRIQERTARLFDSEQRFRLMVDALYDCCIYFVDEEGNITDWTESAQRMHHMDAHQVLRQHFGLLLDAAHPGRNPGTRAQMLRQATESGQAESDGWQIRQGQSAFWARTTLTALRDSQGALQGLSVITKDTTDLKRLEEVMHDLNQDLAQRVQERTHALTAANSDIDAFAHMVSHDLRAPLRHLSDCLSLLRDDLQAPATQLSPDCMAHLGAADRTAHHLALMIDGVLEYARLGRTALAPARVDLGGLLHAAVAACSDRPLEWQIAPAWPPVWGDAVLLERLVMALISNAVKFTRHTPLARVEVGWALAPPALDVQADPASGPMLRWWVRDNGAGFDSTRTHAMFVMFQHQHEAMDFEGVGTGLALCQRIVTLHGGTIRVNSLPGEGCRVELMLPLVPATPPP